MTATTTRSASTDPERRPPSMPGYTRGANALQVDPSEYAWEPPAPRRGDTPVRRGGAPVRRGDAPVRRPGREPDPVERSPRRRRTGDPAERSTHPGGIGDPVERTARRRRSDPLAGRAGLAGTAAHGEGEPAAAPLPWTLPRTPFLVLIAVIVLVGVLGVLVLNTRINENAFRLDNLRAQQNSLDLQEHQLDQQLADLESAGNLSAQAARLGLVPAGTPAFITLPDGKVVGVPRPASGPAAGAGNGAGASDPGR
jgi:hypothetical protein